jgi:hypothetical protein
MVTSFSLHQDRQEAMNRGLEGFEFFGYALGSLYGFGAHKPGRTDLFKEFKQARDKRLQEAPLDPDEALSGGAGGIGTPADMREHLRKFEQAGVDQVTFIQQAGLNKHEHICESLQLFAQEVMPEFKSREAERSRLKALELKPYIEAALARKPYMAQLADADIPEFPALGRAIAEESTNSSSIMKKDSHG